MQLLVLIVGGIVVAVATVYGQDWVEARLEARRANRSAAMGATEVDGDAGPVGPGSGVPERATDATDAAPADVHAASATAPATGGPAS